jgi:hypothetical protein
MLRLGLFNFRNDDVLLIAGDVADVAALGHRLFAEFNSGKKCVAIHDLVSVSSRAPALLFAVQGDVQLEDENAFVWPCSETDIQQLVNADTGAGTLHFDLARTPPYLYMSFSGNYDEQWWASYG